MIKQDKIVVLQKLNDCREILSGEKNLLTFRIAMHKRKPIPPAASGFRVRGLLREALAFFWSTAMRAIALLDGFNLHCGCLKNTPWKWLDLASLSKGAPQPKHEMLPQGIF